MASITGTRACGLHELGTVQNKTDPRALMVEIGVALSSFGRLSPYGSWSHGIVALNGPQTECLQHWLKSPQFSAGSAPHILNKVSNILYVGTNGGSYDGVGLTLQKAVEEFKLGTVAVVEGAKNVLYTDGHSLVFYIWGVDFPALQEWWKANLPWQAEIDRITKEFKDGQGKSSVPGPTVQGVQATNYGNRKAAHVAF